jgi:polar amino acid transport system permease protein
MPTQKYLAEISRMKIGRRRDTLQLVSGVVLALVIIGALVSIASNPRFGWQTVGDYLFHPAILRGLLVTLEMTVIAMTVGVVIGVIVALMLRSRNNVVHSIGWGYTWIMRAIPTLVQLIFWFNLGALYPEITFGIPFLEPLLSVDANTAITPWTAAILGLGLHEGAYMAEIVRSGLLAVPKGQVEAGLALGMPRRLITRRLVLPQAFRIIIPPTGNQVIGMLKLTSLVSVIALTDLLYSAQLIYARTFQVIPLLVVIALWYLLLTSILMVGQHYLEKYMGKSDRDVKALKLPTALSEAA